MSHVKIILTLTITVLVSSLMVFFVEGITTPIIKDYNEKQANIAKYDILPDYEGVFEDTTDTYDLEGTPIVKVEMAESQTVFYTASFNGFNPGITILVGFDLTTNNIIGFRVIEQNETQGLGSVITEEDFQAQFDDLNPNEIDGIAGTTALVTLGGVKNALRSIALFHSVEFEGAVVETPEERLLRLKQEITEVGATFTDVTSDYDLTDSPITKIEESDGNSIVYTAGFDGFNPGVVYLVAFDLTTNDINGFRVVEQFETDGLGAVILEETFQAQFDDLAQDGIDGIAGTTAVITLGALKTSMNDVIDFHKTNIEGTHVETYEEMVERYKEEITVDGAIITDVSGDYDLTESSIIKVELANDKTSDVAVIYNVEFVGYNTGDVVEYIISFDLVTNDILGFRVLYQNETPGYGAAIEEDSYFAQFVDMPQEDAFNGDIDDVAGTSGAPVTMGAFKNSLTEIVTFHKIEFEGIVLETDEERTNRLFLELFPTATDFVKVTRDYAAHYDIEEFYEAYNVETYLGNVYHVKAVGANYSEETYLEFFLGIAEDTTFTGLRMWDDNETTGKATSFYLIEYGDTYTGDNIEEAYTIDDVAGSTLTNNALQAAALAIAQYHVEEYIGREFARPANVDTSESNILAAFTGAVTYSSVYADYEHESNIYNIYEVFDGSSTSLGYVYYGYTNGREGIIRFTWGVDLTDTTINLIITSDSETWNLAEQYGNYHAANEYGYFPDTPWLNAFENAGLTSILSDIQSEVIDGIAGVSITTEGIRDVLEKIAQYHFDQSVGGAG